MVKRIMTLALAFLMLFSVFPTESLRVIAENTENPQTEELTEEFNSAEETEPAVQQVADQTSDSDEILPPESETTVVIDTEPSQTEEHLNEEKTEQTVQEQVSSPADSLPPDTETTAEENSSEGEQQEAEYAEEAVYVLDGELEAVHVQGEAALSQEAAFEALKDITDLDSKQIADITASLFAVGNTLRESDEELPTSLDGNEINSFTAKWITSDSNPNDTNEEELYYVPSGRSNFSVRLQINYAMSGEYAYKPGDIVIRIPANIFHDREGDFTGKVTIPFPENPDTSGDFNWQLIDDYYEIVNTKTFAAATKGYIQINFSNLSPMDLVDMELSDEFLASIEIVTHNGNLIGAKTEALTARFDTDVQLNNVSKKVYGKPTRVGEEDIPINQRIPGVREYIVVTWYAWGNITSNTKYTIDTTDTITGEYNGFIIGASDDQHVLENKNAYVGTTQGNTKNFIFRTAYPANQFEPDTEYVFHNNVEFTVTEVDNGKQTKNFTSAETTWSYIDPEFPDPRGHIYVHVNGNDGETNDYKTHVKDSTGRINTISDILLRRDGCFGIYSSALNHLRLGEDVILSYTVHSIGYVAPWTYDPEEPITSESPSLITNYFRKDATLITTDAGFSVGRDGELLEVGKDYEFVSVEFSGMPLVFKGTAIKVDENGRFNAVTWDDGSVTYEKDPDFRGYPEVVLEIYRNGQWEKWATASWDTGSCLVTLPNGDIVVDTVVDLPADTENYRTVCTLKNAGIWYDVRATIKLKATDEMVNMTEELFDKSNAPEMYLWDKAYIDLYKTEENEHVGRVDKDRDGYDILSGYTTDISVVPSKKASISESDVDYANRKIYINYSAKVEERSLINGRSTYMSALEELLPKETHGIWYDLLPEGVTPIMDTIKLRTNDRITNKYTIENYRGSNRTLLVVEADLTPTPVQYKSGSMYYYEDSIEISFRAFYEFESLADISERIHNVIAFESGNEILGSIENYKGEKDDPYGSENISTSKAFENDLEKRTMKNLDPAADNPNFVYAGAYTTMDIATEARTSLIKDVMVNNDGDFSSGIGENKKVYIDGVYRYRIRFVSDDDTKSSGIVIFDALDTYKPTEGNNEEDIGAPSWMGTFAGVDVHNLEEKGCAPVVYYSVKDITSADLDSVEELHDVNNTEYWIPADAYTGALADVKAVAVDATKKEDGSLFELMPKESVSLYIDMLAPKSDDKDTYVYCDKDAHAYNNAFMICYTEDVETGESDDFVLIRSDYTKVGLEPYLIRFVKKWDDSNNQDGQRPDEITIDVYANDSLIKSYTVSSKDNWTIEVDDLPYTDGDGNKIVYTFKERAIAGYVYTYSDTNDAYVRVITFTNIHKPEKTSISGRKTWVGDTPENRPESVIVKLYADGVYRDKYTITPDSNGNWTYTFDNLYKYKNGNEIKYTIEEELVGNAEYYVSEVDGYDIINRYHPYGDLVIRKDTANDTDASYENEFGFNITFLTLTDDGYAPDLNTYAYDVLQLGNVISSGTITSEAHIVIRGGQQIHVKDINAGHYYTVEEDNSAGYVTTHTNENGTIKPNETIYSIFTNRYASNGKLSLFATKRLENREISAGKFKFELYEIGQNGKATLIRNATNSAQKTIEYNEDGSVAYSIADVIFGSVSFTEKDDGQLKHYRIVEVNDGSGGYTFDKSVYDLYVLVVDNGDGTISLYESDAAGTVGNEIKTQVFDTEKQFVNSYEATGRFDIKCWKDLVGRQLNWGEFVFELLDEEGNLVCETSNDGNGTIIFTDPEMVFDQRDAGKKFYYSVREKVGEDETIIYDTKVIYFEVSVEDNGDGTLKITTKRVDPVITAVGDENVITGYTENTAAPIFTNTLKPGKLSITKSLHEDSEYNGEEFVFTVKLTGSGVEAVRNEDGEEIEGYVVTNEGNTKTGTFTVTIKPGETHTYIDIPSGTTYQVSENTLDGWIPVEQYKTAGTIYPLITAESEIVNYYLPECAAAQIVGVKRISDAPANDGAFEFSLYEDSLDSRPIQTIRNRAGGFIQFDLISYEEVGIHKYYVKEEFISYDNSYGDVVFDEHIEEVTVIVTEIDGVLSAQVVYDEDGILFENREQPGALRINKNVYEEFLTDANKNTVFTFRVTLNNPNGMPFDDEIYWYIEGVTSSSINAAKPSVFANKPMAGIGNGSTAGNQKVATNTIESWSIKPTGNIITYSIFEPTDDMLAGYPYAVYDSSSGTLTFIRSYQTSVSGSTIKDILGNNWTGTIYSGIENTTRDTVPWRSIMASVKTITVADHMAIQPLSTAGWFEGLTDLLETVNLQNLDTSKTTDMSYMFHSSKNTGTNRLTTLDLSTFDTSQVTNMSHMFEDLFMPRTINISSFDTSNVLDMSYMFNRCFSLRTIIFGETFNTSKVTDMNHMFFRCEYLYDFDLSSFDTGNVLDMSYMFYRTNGYYDASNLRTLDLSGFNTSKVTNMSHMFEETRFIEIKGLDNFDTSQVTDMSYMFSGNSSLTTIDLSNFNTAKVENMNHMFWTCRYLNQIDLSSFDTGNVTDMSYMFRGCEKLTELDVSSFNTGKVTTMREMFAECEGLTELDLSNFDTGNVTDMARMFYHAIKLKTVDVSGFNTAHVTSFASMFYYCQSLEKLDLHHFDTSSATTMSGMFGFCTSLEELDISGFDTTTNPSRFERDPMSNMLQGDRNLRRLHLGPKFKFVVTYRYNANLPEAARDRSGSIIYPYSGKWVREDGQYPMDAVSMMNTYNGQFQSGVWVWQLNPDSALIHFDGNGGFTSQEDIVIKSVDEMITMPDLTNTSFVRHILVGWNTEADGSGDMYLPGESYAGIVNLGERITLYAQWEETDLRRYTVNHYQQNSWFSGYSLFETKVYYAEKESSVTPEVFEYEGFVLPEPITEKVLDDDSLVINYYYDRYRYYIVYDGNGATSGTMSDQMLAYNFMETLLPNIYQKTGAMFIGWNTEADGSGRSFTEQQMVMNLVNENNGTITLYAQWIENPNEPKEPSLGVITVQCKAGETIVIPNLPHGTTFTVEEIDVPSGWELAGMSYNQGMIYSNDIVQVSADNVYHATGEAVIKAHKILEGSEIENNMFMFELLDENMSVISSVSNGDVNILEEITDEEGNVVANPWYGTSTVTFDPITYVFNGMDNVIGEHVYYVREVIGKDTTVIYDEHVEKVTVLVSDNGDGTLNTEVVYDEDGALFTNSISPGVLVIGKETNSPNDAEFKFEITLTDYDGNVLEGSYPLIRINTETGEEETGETVKSGDIISLSTFKSLAVAIITDLPADTIYSVKELDTSGWTLVMSRGETGIIAPAAEMVAAFYNEELPPEPKAVKFQLEAYKHVNGGTIEQEDEFTFELLDVAGNILQSKSADEYGSADSKITFDEITLYSDDLSFDEVDNVWRKTYYIHEVIGEQSSVEYDNDEYTVQVVVALNEDGDPAVKEIIYGAYAEDAEFERIDKVTFINTKYATLRLIKADKETAEVLAGAKFTIQYVADGKYLQADSSLGTEPYEFVTDADGKILLGHVLGGEYLIKETSAPKGYIPIEDGLSIEISNGKIIFEGETVNEAVIENQQYSPIVVELEAYKHVIGGTIKKDDDFSFELKDKDGTVLQVKVPDEYGTSDSKITFDEMTLDVKDMEYHEDSKTWTTAFSISEIEGKQPDVVYDATEYTAMITVGLDESNDYEVKNITYGTFENDEFVEAQKALFTNKRYGSLIIHKEVDSYVDNGTNNTFVFEVTIKDKTTGEIKYSNVAGLTLEYGEMSGEVKLENLPLDPETDEVTVEEIYSAGYEGKVEIEFDEATRTYIAKVDNTTTDIIHGSGAVNNYSNKKYVREETE